MLNNLGSFNHKGSSGKTCPTDVQDLVGVLKEISQGSLMKYWKLLQERKL